MPGENLCANEQVRANLVRHLALHSRNAGGVSGGGGASSASSSDREELLPRVLVPDLAPVNPVPHLEGKEKMFDKMTNLAFSSHAAEGAHLFFFFAFLFVRFVKSNLSADFRCALNRWMFLSHEKWKLPRTEQMTYFLF